MLVVCDLVHLDPSWMNGPLRELLDHRLSSPGHSGWWKQQLKHFCRQHGIRPAVLMQLHSTFLKTGKLNEDYLRFLWREVPGIADNDPVVFRRMIKTMSRYGAMFEYDRSGTRELLVPARLPSTVEDDTLDALKVQMSTGIRMQFMVEIDAKYIPPGIVAEFLGGFCEGSSTFFRACWNRGAAFSMDGLEYLVCLHEPTKLLDARIEIDVAGSSKESVAKPGNHVKASLMTLLMDRYPGLLFDATREPIFTAGKDAWQDSIDGLRKHLDGWMDKVRAYLPPCFL